MSSSGRTLKFAGRWALALSAVALCAAMACRNGGGGDEVLARVNGHKIYRAEVEKYFRNQTEGGHPSEEQAQSLRLSIVKQLIDDEILMQRAEKLGLLASDEEVDSKLNEIRAPFTKEEFDARLKERKLTLEDFKRDLRRSLTVEKLLNKEITSKINISDADITNYFNQHKAEFNLIEPQYHLAQILATSQFNPQVGNLKNDKAHNDAEAKKKIQMIAGRLDANEDFATVAMNYSEQPETSQTGGDLGFIPESALKPDRQAFEAISKLKPGQYTPPLAASDPASRMSAYRIIRLISKEPAGQRDLNDPRVQQFIRDQLRTSRVQLLKSAYYESLHNTATVENYLADQILKSTGTK